MREEKAKKRELHPLRGGGNSRTFTLPKNILGEGGSILYSQTSLFYQLFFLGYYFFSFTYALGNQCFPHQNFCYKNLDWGQAFLCTTLLILLVAEKKLNRLMKRFWKILKSSTVFENSSKCSIWILAFSTNFCPIKTDLSGNTVWPQASGFQKLAKMDHFGHF